MIISSIAPMAVPLRVRPPKPVPGQPRSGASMPTPKSDLASRASMVTGLSCSAAVPPQLGNHSQRNLGTAHRGGGRNVWTSPGTDPRPPGGRRRGRVCDLRAGPDHPPARNVLRPRPGAAPSAEPAAARHARWLMREQAVKQITNPAPLVPAQLPPVSPTHPRTTLDQRRGHGDVSSDTEPPDLARPP